MFTKVIMKNRLYLAAAMLILVKVARLSSSPWHRDNWVDIAGYAACGSEVRSKEPDKKPYTMGGSG